MGVGITQPPTQWVLKGKGGQRVKLLIHLHLV